MSNHFNSFCYIRIYSDEQKNIDSDIWISIALRDGSGFNYVTRRLYFDIASLNEALSKLIGLCKVSFSEMVGDNDVGEIYACVDKRGNIHQLNGAEISRDIIADLAIMKTDFIFSVEEAFPEFELSDFKFAD